MSAPRPLVVLGGGEHARVVADAARSRSDLWSLRGYVSPTHEVAFERQIGVPWLGDDAHYLALGAHEDRVVIGVGGTRVNPVRRQLAEQYRIAGFGFASVVHARACVSPGAEVADGALVNAGAIVNTGARIGAHCIVNTGALIEHDVVLAAFASVAPGATLGGGVQVGADTFVGLGSQIRDHIRIGARSLIGMGAVVVADVSDETTVMGHPARVVSP